jgi:hypothetical protein
MAPLRRTGHKLPSSKRACPNTWRAQHQNLFNPSKEPIVERFPTYKRQYWGDDKNGKQVIVLFAMCRPVDGWQERQVLILDGGDCYFMVDYDPATKTFSNLSVNGEA